MQKKNVFVVITVVSLVVVTIYLGFLHKEQKELISSQNKTIQAQEGKINEYNTANDSLLQMLNDFSLRYNISYNGDGNLLDNFSHVFNAQSSLSNSLLFQTKKNQTIIADLNSIKSQLQSKNKLIKGLDTQKDTINFLLQRTDSLSRHIDKITASLLASTTDTISVISPKGVKMFYLGELANDRPMGLGVGFYDKKGYYVGNWYDNMRNGTGKHFYANGDVYEGMFVNDMREGFGIYHYATGDRYVGWWKLDLMSGQGTIIAKDGKKKSGFWLDGKLMEQPK